MVVPGMDYAAEMVAGARPHLGSPLGRKQAAMAPPHLLVDLQSANPPFPPSLKAADIAFTAFHTLRQELENIW